MIEKVFLHEEAVALFVGGGQTVVLIQVNGAHLLKTEPIFLMETDQLLIRADWS